MAKRTFSGILTKEGTLQDIPAFSKRSYCELLFPLILLQEYMWQFRLKGAHLGKAMVFRFFSQNISAPFAPIFEHSGVFSQMQSASNSQYMKFLKQFIIIKILYFLNMATLLIFHQV